MIDNEKMAQNVDLAQKSVRENGQVLFDILYKYLAQKSPESAEKASLGSFRYIDNLSSFGIFTKEHGQYLKLKFIVQILDNMLNKTNNDGAKSVDMPEIQDALKDDLKNDLKSASKDALKGRDEDKGQNGCKAFKKGDNGHFESFENGAEIFENDLSDLRAESGENPLNDEKAVNVSNTLKKAQDEALMAEKIKKIQEENKTAISRLKTPSFSAEPSEIEAKHNFSRNEISKMSDSDFLKYEKEIMEQMAKGLIK